MRAFLEKTEKEWMDDFVYLSIEPLKNMGVEILPFNGIKTKSLYKNGIPIAFEEIDFKPTDIVIGSVEATDLFFKKLGKEITYLGYPESLQKFLNREIKLTTMGEVETQMPYPFFLKPALEVKLFTGSLCENKKQLDLVYFDKGVTKGTSIFVSQPLNFTSEYRCFIHKNQLVGIKHYKGDFTQFPDVKEISKMIECYEDAPISYTLDVGIVGDQTVLVEVNDFWAIGGYGLDGKTYVRMLIDRFQEICRNE